MPTSAYAFLRPSPFTRLDPRLRVVLALLISTTVAVFTQTLALLPLALCAAVLLLLARPPLRPLAQRFLTVNFCLKGRTPARIDGLTKTGLGGTILPASMGVPPP